MSRETELERELFETHQLFTNAQEALEESDSDLDQARGDIVLLEGAYDKLEQSHVILEEDNDILTNLAQAASTYVEAVQAAARHLSRRVQEAEEIGEPCGCGCS